MLAFGLNDDPLWLRLLSFGLAALIVINFLFSWRDPNHGGLGDETRQAKRPTTRNEE